MRKCRPARPGSGSVPIDKLARQRALQALLCGQLVSKDYAEQQDTLVCCKPAIRLFKLLRSGSRAAQSELAMGHSCSTYSGQYIDRAFALELCQPGEIWWESAL